MAAMEENPLRALWRIRDYRVMAVPPCVSVVVAST
jgi:hypothetical protein